ncbi:unnamed protein product, partial [Polarella glacialis]
KTTLLAIAIAAASAGGHCFVDLDEVQHPLDRGVDFVLSPVWRLVEPVACLASYLLLSPARLHLRLEAGLTADHGRASL